MTHTTAFPSTDTIVTDHVPGAGAFARLRAAVMKMRQRQISRRQYAHLLACDEHVLHDVGLTRADVLRAMREQS